MGGYKLFFIYLYYAGGFSKEPIRTSLCFSMLVNATQRPIYPC